ncbi:MAG: type II secretion system F family protein [Candidatus Yanofskybacteria bacterium]|nr:type II secretion system F family protein [Candidatus Yanofskybacteria bacterium]
MSQFTYEAKDKEGKLINGVIDALSEDAAVETLHDKGFVILSLVAVERGLFKGGDINSFLVKPNKKDVTVFTRQLATIIAADIPLIEGLETIASQAEKESFARIVKEMAEAIRGGSSLSTAVSKQPKLFGDFYVSLVKSGEVSGRLEKTLNYLADYLERSQSLNSKIRGAMAYPMFIVFALGIVGFIMMTFVLPKLLSILTESGVEDIPIITRVLIKLTNFVNNYILLVLFSLIFLAWFTRQYVRTKTGKYKIDRLKISFPRLGVIARNIYIARMSETLSTLVKAGVPILEGLRITSEIVGNFIFRDMLLEAEKNVRNGGSISAVLTAHKDIPKLVSSMLAIGEKTGKTDFMLDNIYNFYNAEAERDIQNLSQLIEPILILLLGVGAGLLVAGILLPIFSLVGAA